ncbi:MAG: 4-hydroxythreonine-4-phosphate dehydrogenase PdxA [Geminicoccaceae bacterium]
MRARRLALTMGDPAGIGPEIVLKALKAVAERPAGARPELCVTGTRACLADTAALLGMDEVRFVDGPAGAVWPEVAVVEAASREAPTPPGIEGAEGGRLAYFAIEKAVALARAGEVDALVTAPLNKAALNAAGYHFPGHTELLAHLCGTRGTVLMLAHGSFRVTHVTTHVALDKVPGLVTPERVRRVIELTLGALRQLGIERPRVAVAALNPHAGEGGIFGRQDIEVTAPVVAALRAAGEAVEGPVPGDTVFVNLRGGHYDAVVAMYHDQGHIPVKLLGFDVDPETGRWRALSGVNVTLGLPIIRTSVDHGTAFDIAGRGIADATSMVEAIDYADQLSASGRTGR